MIHTTSILLTWLLAVSAGGAQRGPQQELAAARETWAAQKIDSYEFTFQASCFCEAEFLRPVTFRIDDGVSVLLTDVSERVRGHFDRFDTVEKLFDFVGAALDQKAFKLVAVYDSDRGYPRSVQVDYRQMTKDEEMRLKVTDFKVVRRQ